MGNTGIAIKASTDLRSLVETKCEKATCPSESSSTPTACAPSHFLSALRCSFKALLLWRAFGASERMAGVWRRGLGGTWMDVGSDMQAWEEMDAE